MSTIRKMCNELRNRLQWRHFFRHESLDRSYIKHKKQVSKFTEIGQPEIGVYVRDLREQLFNASSRIHNQQLGKNVW